MIKIKRIYETPQKEDGFRILVDRLWPRGLSKEGAKIHLWEKDIAPSDRLRKWFAHDVEKWAAFKKKYGEELKQNRALLGKIKELEKEHATLTLLFAAKDVEHNNALVLHQMLKRMK